MASLFQYLSPLTPKALSPVSTLSQIITPESCTKYTADENIVQTPEATYLSPYSQQGCHSNQRTRNQFRPRNATKGTTSYQLRQYAEATLGGGSLRKIVKLPEGEDEDEWLAVNSRYLGEYLWIDG